MRQISPEVKIYEQPDAKRNRAELESSYKPRFQIENHSISFLKRLS